MIQSVTNRQHNDTQPESWSANSIEMAILCNMIVNEGIAAMVLDELHENHFHDERNRLLFRSLQQLTVPASETRFEALLRLLERDGLMEAAGGKAYVVCVYLYVPTGGVDDLMRLLVRKAA